MPCGNSRKQNKKFNNLSEKIIFLCYDYCCQKGKSINFTVIFYINQERSLPIYENRNNRRHTVSWGPSDFLYKKMECKKQNNSHIKAL